MTTPTYEPLDPRVTEFLVLSDEKVSLSQHETSNDFYRRVSSGQDINADHPWAASIYAATIQLPIALRMINACIDGIEKISQEESDGIHCHSHWGHSLRAALCNAIAPADDTPDEPVITPKEACTVYALLGERKYSEAIELMRWLLDPTRTPEVDAQMQAPPDPHAEWLDPVKRETWEAFRNFPDSPFEGLPESTKRGLDRVARRVVARRCAATLHAVLCGPGHVHNSLCDCALCKAIRKRVLELDAIAEGGGE